MNQKAVEVFLKHLAAAHKKESNLTDEEAIKSANEFFHDTDYSDVAKTMIDAMEDYASILPKWNSLKISMPPLGTNEDYENASEDVLVTDGVRIELAFYESGWASVKTEESFDDFEPTHWMSLNALLPVS